jgi:hypothetical protein
MGDQPANLVVLLEEAELADGFREVDAGVPVCPQVQPCPLENTQPLRLLRGTLTVGGLPALEVMAVELIRSLFGYAHLLL